MKNPLIKKLANFKGSRDNYKKKNKKVFVQYIIHNKSIKQILSNKIRRFGRNKKEGTYGKMSFSVKDLLEKIGQNPVCQLTGRPINLLDGPSYHLDHIIPKKQGGTNNLDNCQILCREANQAKNDMLPDQFIQLCREVLIWHNKNVWNSSIQGR